MQLYDDKTTLQNFGEILKGERYAEHKSQKDFAREWGISERTLRMLEEGQGHLSLDTLLAMVHKKDNIVFVYLMKASHKESIEEVLGVYYDAKGNLVRNPTYDKLVGSYNLNLDKRYKGETFHFRSKKSKIKKFFPVE